jgi:Holliday junction resolvasome RuvABC endonuclease subunit
VAELPLEENGVDARFSVLGFRERSRESGAEWAFEAAKRIPQAIALKWEDDPPDVVYVERPIVPKGQLRQAIGLGRAQGLIVAGFQQAGVKVIEEMTPGEWRIGVAGVGYGNAPKAIVHEKLGELWLPELPRDENLRDALCIAWAARRENARGR